MSDPESDSPLWKLLGQASQAGPSPYFVRRVVREAKAASAAPPSLRERLRHFLSRIRRPLLASAAIALLAVAGAALLRPGAPTEADRAHHAFLQPEAASDSDVFDPASEMAAVEYLGQLMAVADPGQLDDDALAALF